MDPMNLSQCNSFADVVEQCRKDGSVSKSVAERQAVKLLCADKLCYNRLFKQAVEANDGKSLSPLMRCGRKVSDDQVLDLAKAYVQMLKPDKKIDMTIQNIFAELIGRVTPHLSELFNSREIRTQLFEELVKSKSGAVECQLIPVMDKLGIESSEEKWKYCELLASRAPSTAAKLVEQIDRLDLTSEEVLRLFKLVLSKTYQPYPHACSPETLIIPNTQPIADAILKNFAKLGSQSKEDRFKLYETLASKNKYTAIALAKNIDKLSLQPNEGLQLAELLLSEKFDRDDHSLSTRDEMGNVIAANFAQLGLKTCEERSQLLCLMLQTYPTSYGNLAEEYHKSPLSKNS